ncbi:phosphatase PAP2 family protein [Thermoleophilum album]|uniref:5'-phosphoribosyl-monophospho-decaprenol phosphatase n=1 Tax=Thermoleophilum album TaxID=29539 RepID=A0A1H6FKH3_THEAL|nr:phosphatase PAP2 family protein [Thermoleophilum album]SEH11357.1 5'-phosphoribosyl-monophospho-decaprenol phosphatase [Thermoleophilum album]
MAAAVGIVRGTALESAARVAATFGEYGLGWLLLAIGGAGCSAIRGDMRAARRWLAAARAVVLAFLASQVIKRLVRRRRPGAKLARVKLYSDRSFPSAHAACAAAFARSAPYRSAAAAVAKLAAAWVALSRFLVGVHYPSDVAVGLAIGALIGREVVER